VPSQTTWLHVPAARPGARLRLYCIPYAGGGSAVYRDWPSQLDARVEVRTIVLPGRERRFVEPALSSVLELADLLVPALLPVLDPPFAIFGHSMGAMLGFELACRLTSAGRPPVHMLASGARAPHLRDHGPQFHAMPDADFVASVGGLGGTPAELLEHEELLRLMLPTLRADFTAAETYRSPTGRPLPCPITAFGGDRDPLVGRVDLDGWSSHTAGGFGVHMLPGDHFFLHTARAELLPLVRDALAPHLRV